MGRYESGEGKVERLIKWCSGGVDSSSNNTGFVHLSPFFTKISLCEGGGGQRRGPHPTVVKIKCWHLDRVRINLKAKDFNRKQFRRSVLKITLWLCSYILKFQGS